MTENEFLRAARAAAAARPRRLCHLSPTVPPLVAADAALWPAWSAPRVRAAVGGDSPSRAKGGY